MVLRSCSANSIHSYCETAIGAVFETHGKGQTGSQLTVKLTLGRPSTNGTQRDQIGQKLRTDGIQHLTSNGHALRSQIAEQLSADFQALVDGVAFVDIWIVDQALPADCCSWLFEVGAHDDAEVIFQLVGELDEAGAVFYGSFGVVEGAWADHDEETVITLLDDFDGLFAAFVDCVERGLARWEFGGEELWWNERVVAQDLVIISQWSELLTRRCVSGCK